MSGEINMEDIDALLNSDGDDDDTPDWRPKASKGSSKPVSAKLAAPRAYAAAKPAPAEAKATPSAAKADPSARTAASRSEGPARAAPASTSARAAPSTTARAAPSAARAERDAPRELTLDDLDNIDTMVAEAHAEAAEDDLDLPDWRNGQYGKAGRPKAYLPKGEWGKGDPNKKVSAREQLKKGIVAKSAREEAEEEVDEEPRRPARSGVTDVTDRLTDTRAFTGTSKNRFGTDGTGRGLSGRDMGNENVIVDLKDITRAGNREPTARKQYVPKERPEEEPIGADFDDAEYDGDLGEEDTALDYAEYSKDDEAELIRQAQEELKDDNFGLPDYKSGKYRNKNTPKPKAVAATKAAPKAPLNLRQQLAQGKEVLSAREQAEQDAASAKSAVHDCALAGCGQPAPVGEKYCEKHSSIGRHNPEMLRKARDAKRAEEAEAAPQEQKECFGCARALSGDIVSAMGEIWHPACFKCKRCRNEFPGGKFINMDGWPYCRPCAQTLNERNAKQPAKGGGGGEAGGQCHGCSRTLAGDIVQAMDNLWHPDCFKCRKCRKPFPGGVFINLDDMPHCKPCAQSIHESRQKGR